MSYDENLDHPANQAATTARLRALLVDFMRAEGVSDLVFTFSACLVNVQGNPTEDVTVAVSDLMWQDVGDDWSHHEGPAEILPFRHKAPE